MTTYSISINTLTDGHASSDTWVVAEETAAAIRAGFVDPPDATQLVPIELADEFINHKDHVSF